MRLISRAEIFDRIDNLDKDILFRYSFVPFCIAEGAWDYADSAMDMARLLNLYETRHISRTIKQLRSSYNSKRTAEYIRCRVSHDRAHENEMNNFLELEDAYKGLFKDLYAAINTAINNQYPELDTDNRGLLMAAYSCHFLLQCIFSYSNKFSEIVAKELGVPYLNSIIPDELFKLDKVVMLYAGDKTITFDSVPMMKEFVKGVSTIQFINIEQNESKD